MIQNQNRYVRAREQSGLSSCQAARLLGITVAEPRAVEITQRSCCTITAGRLADIYGVSVEWLTGEAPYRDYAAVDRAPGAHALTFHDRDVLAEFMALARRRETP